MDFKEKISALRERIEQHEYDYLILGEKTISDFELESLKIELDRLERKYNCEGTRTDLEAVAC